MVLAAFIDCQGVVTANSFNRCTSKLFLIRNQSVSGMACLVTVDLKNDMFPDQANHEFQEALTCYGVGGNLAAPQNEVCEK